MGYTGPRAPDRQAKAFDAVVRGARRRGRRSCSGRWRPARSCAGWQVDRAASSVLRSAGYGDQILHRTGHSLGEDVHGNGVNMDDYETHDDRRLLPGTGFTIEPGVYFDDFGVRTEINMIVRRSRGGGHRTAARAAIVSDCVLRRNSMSTRKTTFFYVLLTAVASFAVALVIASRLDLTPASSAQTHRGAVDEQRADRRADRRARRSATSRRRSRRWSSTSAPR